MTPAIRTPSHAASRVAGLLVACAAALLTACSGLPDKPTRSLMYDFGPGDLTTQPMTREAPLPPIALDDIRTAGGALDNMAVLYRLNYTDGQQLRSYAQARWGMPPAALVRKRIAEKLGQRRSVFNAGDSVSLNRAQNAVLPPVLRMDLEEFSHVFTAPETSVGVIRLRATLVEVTPSGDKLLGQRSIVVQRPAPTNDAPGGVRALTAATDAAIGELDQWLQQARPR